jgi:hypothetical protein
MRKEVADIPPAFSWKDRKTTKILRKDTCYPGQDSNMVYPDRSQNRWSNFRGIIIIFLWVLRPKEMKSVSSLYARIVLVLCVSARIPLHTEAIEFVSDKATPA